MPRVQKNLLSVTGMYTPTPMVPMGNATNRLGADFIWTEHLRHSKKDNAGTKDYCTLDGTLSRSISYTQRRIVQSHSCFGSHHRIHRFLADLFKNNVAF